VHDVDDRSGEWSGVKTERMEWLNWNVDMLVRCLAETAMWYSTHTRPVDRSTTSSTTGWSVTRTCTLHRVYLYTGCTCTQGVLVHRVYLYTGCTCTQGVSKPVDKSTTSSTTGWSVTRTCTLHRVFSK